MEETKIIDDTLVLGGFADAKDVAPGERVAFRSDVVQMPGVLSQFLLPEGFELHEACVGGERVKIGSVLQVGQQVVLRGVWGNSRVAPALLIVGDAWGDLTPEKQEKCPELIVPTMRVAEVDQIEVPPGHHEVYTSVNFIFRPLGVEMESDAEGVFLRDLQIGKSSQMASYGGGVPLEVLRKANWRMQTMQVGQKIRVVFENTSGTTRRVKVKLVGKSVR